MVEPVSFGPVLTENELVKDALKQAKQAASSDVNMLITGESGTGKNVLSKAIHRESRRKTGPFVHVNCLAIPDTLIESELLVMKRRVYRCPCFKKGEL